MERSYLINCYKSRDASSIIWVSDEYKINELDPYVSSIMCDDGDEIHHLIHADSPYADGKDDFKLIELNDFEAVKGDSEREYLLCFSAVVRIDLNKHPNFKQALNKSENQIVPRIWFKKRGQPLVDKDGYAKYLYEMDQDIFIGLEEV